MPKKDERIFGFTNFNDFKEKYFGGREVDPLEEVTRIKVMKEARMRYSNKNKQQLA